MIFHDSVFHAIYCAVAINFQEDNTACHTTVYQVVSRMPLFSAIYYLVAVLHSNATKQQMAFESFRAKLSVMHLLLE